MSMDFSTLESVSRHAIPVHEQCIFIICESADRERSNIQRLIKINWTKINFFNLTLIAYSYK